MAGKAYKNGYGPSESTPSGKPKRKQGKLGGTANKKKKAPKKGKK